MPNDTVRVPNSSSWAVEKNSGVIWNFKNCKRIPYRKAANGRMEMLNDDNTSRDPPKYMSKTLLNDLYIKSPKNFPNPDKVDKYGKISD